MNGQVLTDDDENAMSALNSPRLSAIIKRLAALVQQLLSEVREWLCSECRTVYPGPPQDGVRCVICPKCGGTTAPRQTVERRQLEAEVTRLQALVEKQGKVVEAARFINDNFNDKGHWTSRNYGAPWTGFCERVRAAIAELPS